MTSPSSSDWRPKALLFDLLTALLDSWSLWSLALSSSPHELSRRKLTHEELSSLALQWRKQYLYLTFSCGLYQPYESLVKQAAIDVGLPSTVSEVLVEKWGELRAWPEVEGVLERLKGDGYKLGVVTNCSRELGRIAVEKLGVEFDGVITAEEAGFYKPRKEAYEAGIEALGLTADEVLFVAGSSGDVVGAAEAGMKVVWNNHIGLELKPGAKPLREGKTLDEALADFL